MESRSSFRVFRPAALLGIVILSGLTGMWAASASGLRSQEGPSHEISSTFDVQSNTGDTTTGEGFPPQGEVRNDEAAVEDHSTVSMVEPPRSLYDMVVGADAIVIGTVEGIEYERLEGPYSVVPQSAGNDAGSTDAEEFKAGFTYFRVTVERVLMSNGALQPGGTFPLRIDGSASKSKGTYGNLAPFPEVGESLLLVLNVNPDHASYGTRGPWGRIALDDQAVTYLDWSGTPVPFADGLTAQEFVDLLESTIRQVQIESQR